MLIKNNQKYLAIIVVLLLLIGGGYVYVNRDIITPVINITDNSQTPSEANNTHDNKASSQTGDNYDAKKYSDESVSFEYPSLLKVTTNGGLIELSHSIVYKHPNPCDFKGDGPLLENLTDFELSIKVVNQDLKSYLQNLEYPGWDYVSTNPYKLGSLNGFNITEGIEGCGFSVYYFPVGQNKSLVISRRLVTEFLPISGDSQASLSLSDIIKPDQEEEFFTNIVSSLKVK